jgi:hypothetical protein
VRIILFLGNHTEINQRLSMSQKLILKYGIHTYHVGLGALRHVHDLDGDDLAVEREAARPVHDGGAPVSDRLEQLVVRRPDGELPLPPLGRGRPRLILPLLREPHRSADRSGGDLSGERGFRWTAGAGGAGEIEDLVRAFS